MSLTIPIATARLTRMMQEAERTADQAAIDTSALIVETISTRSAFRDHEAARFAHPALARMQRAQEKLIAAQGELARAHAQMLEAYRVTAGPDHPTCPEPGFTGAELPSTIAA